mmetsp:Transcript_124659/g.399376  ORF Transcript_124659/g.399376 Transcript_124659/m.399376 type:complete len:210 (+) Transcript_124659:1479-2108(+)
MSQCEPMSSHAAKPVPMAMGRKRPKSCTKCPTTDIERIAGDIIPAISTETGGKEASRERLNSKSMEASSSSTAFNKACAVVFSSLIKKTLAFSWKPMASFSTISRARLPTSIFSWNWSNIFLAEVAKTSPAHISLSCMAERSPPAHVQVLQFGSAKKNWQPRGSKALFRWTRSLTGPCASTDSRLAISNAFLNGASTFSRCSKRPAASL